MTSSDMNDRERIERARRAKLALDEFMAPAFAAVEADYGEKMIAAASGTDPRANDVIARLANGIKAARQVKAYIETFVYDGELAKAGMIRAERVEAMTPAQRRLLNIGQ